jgi:hypothetical protein
VLPGNGGGGHGIAGWLSEKTTKNDGIMAWEDWYSRIGNALVDAGNPFGPRARSITSDGMIIDDSNGCMPSGYSIIQADSIDSAVKLAQTCPILKDGAKVSVYETFNAMAI